MSPGTARKRASRDGWIEREVPTTVSPALTGDAYEDTRVQPVEVARRGLDLGGGAEDVLARVDVVAAGESPEDLRAAVAHALRSDVEQRAAVGLQRVTDVAERSAVRQHDL